MAANSARGRSSNFRAETSGASPPEADGSGYRLLEAKECLTCHSVDGSEGRSARPLREFLAAPTKLTNGSTVTADDAYLRESIVHPEAKIVDGLRRRDARSPSSPMRKSTKSSNT